jgi:hypothetical protein
MLTTRHGPFFENIFFEKFEKSLPFFKKNSKKIRKKFALQIYEISEDVSVSNGVLILKKAVLIINSFYVTYLDRFLSTIKYQNSNF